jgi:hypothetical protein
MTEYDDRVEEQRVRLKYEEWSKGVKHLIAQNGVIETAFNNGDIKYETRQPDGSYKTKWYRAKASEESLMHKFGQMLADRRMW